MRGIITASAATDERRSAQIVCGKILHTTKVPKTLDVTQMKATAASCAKRSHVF